MSIIDDLKNTFSMKHNGLNRLLLVNVILFLAANLTKGILQLSGHSFSPVFVQLALASDFSYFAEHFWTLFTYMFFHLDFFHIFFNMLWLYSFGSVFAEFLGSKRLVAVYVLGGLAGGLLFLLLGAFLPRLGGGLLGASAGVMAIIIATAVYSPNLQMNVFLLGPVKLKYIALVSFVAFSLLDITDNTGGKVAHIGGAAFGFIFALQYRKGNDLTRGLTGILDSLLHLFNRKPKSNVKVAYKRPVPDDVYNEIKVNEQKRVNEILDKISRSGYESLSKEEKDFLFNASRKM
jgi:membrane associated rhomboid family serine protease